MPETRSMAPVGLHQLKVTLRDVKPPVWRRVLVPPDVSLRKLHRVLQIVMGWTDTHLYEFTVGRANFGDRDEDAPSDLRSARTAKLSSVAPAAGAKLLYEYDFGDGWQHDVSVEAIVAPEDAVRYPACVAGKRACPPEDCGGSYGYAELLEALADTRSTKTRSIGSVTASTRRRSTWTRSTHYSGASGNRGHDRHRRGRLGQLVSNPADRRAGAPAAHCTNPTNMSRVEGRSLWQ